jgi:hypothetical protein
MKSQCVYVHKCGTKKGNQCQYRVLPTIKLPNKVLCSYHQQLINRKNATSQEEILKMAAATNNSRGKKRNTWDKKYKLEKYDILNNSWSTLGIYPSILAITEDQQLSRYFVKQIINDDSRLRKKGAYKITKIT